MGRPIVVRSGYSSAELRGLAKRSRDADQARRLLSIAAVVDGASRAEAAKLGGMDRQTLRDWMHRFNADGPDGLVNHAAPGASPKLTPAQQAEVAALVERGPIPAVDGVVRWRACDLVAWIYGQFAVSVSDATVYRLLERLGFSHMSARPKAYKQDAQAITAFKKTSPRGWRKFARSTGPARRSRSGSRTR
jgi:transposase